jgi:putative transposase
VPRQLRDAAVGVHHIGVGAAGPAEYFRDDVDHITWTRLFVRTLDRYGWTCIAVCELSTHWHALVDVPDESLPRGMHFLNSMYAKAFNARHDRVGYLVRDRYWSRRKATDSAVLTAFRYVAQNPVKAGVSERPEDCFWSSFATTIGLASTFAFVDATLVLMQFGSSRAAAVAALRRFVGVGL